MVFGRSNPIGPVQHCLGIKCWQHKNNKVCLPNDPLDERKSVWFGLELFTRHDL